MKINNKGRELYNTWEKHYCNENDNLGGDSKSGYFVEGWCIIDNDEYVKTLDDICGLMLFGYDEHAIDQADEWIRLYGQDDKIWNGYTCLEIKNELLQYFILDK